jgi:integrase
MSAKGQPRPRREATGVYLRGRTWWICYRGPGRDGVWSTIFETSRSTRKQDAVRLRKDRLFQIEAAKRSGPKFQHPTDANRLTVNDLLDNLVRDYETQRLRSLRQALVHMKHIRAVFGSEKAIWLTKAKVDAYIAGRRKPTKKLPRGAADATIDRETELLRRAFRLAHEAEILVHVPAFPKRLVKKNENARDGFVERAEFERLLPELPTPVLRDLALWAYATGMRKGEALALTWEAYDKETKTIRLPARSAKTGKGRLLSLVGWPEVAAVIDRRLKARRFDCSLIFHSEGGRLRERDFSSIWQRACERAGVKKFTFHDLRRTAVRNMIRAGVDRDVAKKISGHETDSIFSRYNIADDADLAEAMRRRAEYEAKLPTESQETPVLTIGPA